MSVSVAEELPLPLQREKEKKNEGDDRDKFRESKSCTNVIECSVYYDVPSDLISFVSYLICFSAEC